MIHVYVQYGRNFKLESLEEDGLFGKQEKQKKPSTFNAMVVVQVGDKKLYSKAKEGALTNRDTREYWGEHFFFEPRGHRATSLCNRASPINHNRPQCQQPVAPCARPPTHKTGRLH